jgi:hypothetical protein
MAVNVGNGLNWLRTRSNGGLLWPSLHLEVTSNIKDGKSCIMAGPATLLFRNVRIQHFAAMSCENKLRPYVCFVEAAWIELYSCWNIPRNKVYCLQLRTLDTGQCCREPKKEDNVCQCLKNTCRSRYSVRPSKGTNASLISWTTLRPKESHFETLLIYVLRYFLHTV